MLYIFTKKFKALQNTKNVIISAKIDKNLFDTKIMSDLMIKIPTKK